MPRKSRKQKQKQKQKQIQIVNVYTTTPRRRTYNKQQKVPRQVISMLSPNFQTLQPSLPITPNLPRNFIEHSTPTNMGFVTKANNYNLEDLVSKILQQKLDQKSISDSESNYEYEYDQDEDIPSIRVPKTQKKITKKRLIALAKELNMSFDGIDTTDINSLKSHLSSEFYNDSKIREAFDTYDIA
jgi:hypothetical protein